VTEDYVKIEGIIWYISTFWKGLDISWRFSFGLYGNTYLV